MKRLFTTLAVLFVGTITMATAQQANERPIYLDPDAPIEERVEDALSRMTLREKIAIIHAQSKFSAPGVPRLGISEIWCTDGPHGIRPEVMWDEWDQARWTNDSCIAYPALTCLAATWNRDCALSYGRSIGEEARFRDKDVLLGPGVNIYRTPLCGRNFEYMGEDPYLASEMVVPYVKGVQEQGVAACVKHYALNNEEQHRHTVDVSLSDRALREIYLPAFKAAVTEGGAWSLMGSYNKYRGTYACHNHRLLVEILKQEWGFDGAVISDWGGVHSTEEAIHNGLDMEFGTWTDGLREGASNAYDNYYMALPYLKLIESGEVGTEELDDKVRRVLRLTFRTAMNNDKPYGAMCSEAHSLAARQIAEEGIVLLKNHNNNLPIAPDAKRILVVGENAIKMMTVGGGSSSLKVKYECSPLDGIRNYYGDDVEVLYARGYVGDVTGDYNGVVTGQNLVDKRSPKRLIAEAVEMAREADHVIFIGGLNKSNNQDCEGTDRRNLGLPYNQDAVIEALAEVSDNLTVVFVSGNAVAMPWIDEVESVVQVWYLGSEAGNAIANVLSGEVNPSGKLPFTFGAKLEDYMAHADGAKFPNPKKVFYHDGIFVGYRSFEKREIEPLFAFGHGLSYTTFEYSNLQLSATEAVAGNRIDETILEATVTITNRGDRAGKEVVQLYISDVESSVIRPKKELKGFEKVELQPGESKTITFSLTPEALAFYNENSSSWTVENGEYRVLIGASSADIRLDKSFTLR
ncbi:MAG: glycoside hydrolase family 3 C-terminal domain-containing protein [Alistipes sp.]|nr:glycoside hydrolase family 3 C-terminal domain-containing protein [Alistipes sp.]